MGGNRVSGREVRRFKPHGRETQGTRKEHSEADSIERRRARLFYINHRDGQAREYRAWMQAAFQLADGGIALTSAAREQGSRGPIPVNIRLAKRVLLLFRFHGGNWLHGTVCRRPTFNLIQRVDEWPVRKRC